MRDHFLNYFTASFRLHTLVDETASLRFSRQLAIHAWNEFRSKLPVSSVLGGKHSLVFPGCSESFVRRSILLTPHSCSVFHRCQLYAVHCSVRFLKRLMRGKSVAYDAPLIPYVG